MKKRRRTYVLKARGKRLAETHQRIAQATMELHQEVGPRHTTISAIADRAGVERLTVYRHFPDEDALYAACSARFTELNPPPDPAGWSLQPVPRDRSSQALSSIYGYFAGTAPMLERLHRDAEEIAPLSRVMKPFLEYLGGVAGDLAAHWRPGDPCIAAACRHALSFPTWRSLDQERIDNPRKVAMVLTWLDALLAHPVR
jgi:AcrR family transcriptional regulator